LGHYTQAKAGFPGGTIENVTAGLPYWCTFGIAGLDMRAAWTCLIGIILAVALNKCTEYFTGTEYSPVKSLAMSCETGHATNIIQGFAVGYESTVAAVLIIAAAIMCSALIYVGTTPTFIAFGVAMCGIGMWTLTGNTISMDVFGPVADNANCIGEMGYDKAEMGEAKYKEARQILADWTPSATPPKPSPRASPSDRPSSPPCRCSTATSSRSARAAAAKRPKSARTSTTPWPRC